MSQTPIDIQKTLIEVKVRLLQGLHDEGFRLLDSIKDKIDLNQHNWLLCNIIDIGECDVILKFLEKFGELFNLARCKNLKRLVICSILNNGNISKYLEIAINEIIRRGEENVIFDIIVQTISENEKINYNNLLKIAESYKLLGFYNRYTQLIDIACRSGIKELCKKI
ncbi:MAG: DUF1955 domain-containing protein [Sulfolobaceae archaeon]